MTTTTDLRPEHSTATQNACNLCAPLGAALAFKGVANCVPLLHGSQGCSTYIRRYMISHFKEPLDIACSNFGEQTAIFGGGANLKLALDNIRKQYTPDLIGIATTCLSETIGDDVPMFIKSYQVDNRDEALPALVHVATPSYQGTHMQGFHGAVRALVAALSESGATERATVNLFPGMVSPSDLRHLKDILAAFGLEGILVPDYSDTLNGPLWSEYQRIPEGGTPVTALRHTGRAAASIECGLVLAEQQEHRRHLAGDPSGRSPAPAGAAHRNPSDRSAVRSAFSRQRPAGAGPLHGPAGAPAGCHGGRPQAFERRAGRYSFGEEDIVAGLAGFCSELGIIPVLCATGGGKGCFATAVKGVVPERYHAEMQILEDVDFVTIEKTLEAAGKVDLLIGHSKGFTMSRRLKRPLVRVGFPVHDRVDGSRLLHLGYRGAQQLFDRIANTLIEEKQKNNAVGYTYY